MQLLRKNIVGENNIKEADTVRRFEEKHTLEKGRRQSHAASPHISEATSFQAVWLAGLARGQLLA